MASHHQQAARQDHRPDLSIVGGTDFSSPAFPPRWSPLAERQQTIEALLNAKAGADEEPDQLLIEALAGEQLANDVAWIIGAILLTLALGYGATFL